MILAGYLAIGCIYGLINLVLNMRDNGIFSDETKYCNAPLGFKFVYYALDLVLWPVGVVLDIRKKVKEASK